MVPHGHSPGLWIILVTEFHFEELLFVFYLLFIYYCIVLYRVVRPDICFLVILAQHLIIICIYIWARQWVSQDLPVALSGMSQERESISNGSLVCYLVGTYLFSPVLYQFLFHNYQLLLEAILCFAFLNSWL